MQGSVRAVKAALSYIPIPVITIVYEIKTMIHKEYTHIMHTKTINTHIHP